MKRLITLALLLVATPARADDVITTLYATAKSVHFCLRDQTDANKFYNSADFTAASCASSACCKYSIDGGSWTSCTGTPTADARKCYTLAVSAAELTGGEIVFAFEDQTGTKRWADKVIRFLTYGHPSAWHKIPQYRRD